MKCRNVKGKEHNTCTYIKQKTKEGDGLMDHSFFFEGGGGGGGGGGGWL